MNMLRKVKDTIDMYQMLIPGDKVIVCVSGGPDSVALLHSLNQIKDDYQIQLYVAHVNHLLRGEEAFADAQFVNDLAHGMGIQCRIQEEDVGRYARLNGFSEEQAGREKRYAFFEKLRIEIGATKIALGHNLNDQAETVLQHLIRGGGLKGLGGMEPVRQNYIIRPLISTLRQEIQAYLEKNNLPYRVDKTNLESIYFRNQIRMELLPFLQKQYNPNMISLLAQTADILRQDEAYLEQNVEEAAETIILLKNNDTLKIDLKLFNKLHIAVKRRLIRKAIKLLTGGLKEVTFNHVDAILNLSCKEQGFKRLSLPQNICVEKQYHVLWIRINVPKQSEGGSAITCLTLLNVPGRTEISFAHAFIEAKIIKRQEFNILRVNKNTNTVYIDYEKVNERLAIRFRQPGDRFQPLGMKGTKKLKNFFIDCKIPQKTRDDIPLLVCGEDIVWVVGYQINASYQITSETEKILQLQIERER